MNRRQALALAITSTLGAGATLANAEAPTDQYATAGQWQQPSPINIIIPATCTRQYKSLAGFKFEYQLAAATLDFLSTHYKDRQVPVWEKKFNAVSFQKRIPLITHFVLQSVDKYTDVYPVDPVWIMAQIMTESFFCEWAVSSSLAVGICQFITPTARKYNLLCATDNPAHLKPPYKKTELAGAEKKFLATREKLRFLRKQYSTLFNDPLTILEHILTGPPPKKIQGYARILAQAKQLQKQIITYRKNYQTYLHANILDKNIFDSRDLSAISAFDQRATIKHPIDAMVLMMAQHLRECHGNIIAATAGYNAGLGTTKIPYGEGKPYGRLPVIQETVDYVNKIFIRHHELVKRIKKA